jgi:hypothetical protein
MRQDFLLSVALTAGETMPAGAQTVTPATGPAKGGAFIPDFARA